MLQKDIPIIDLIKTTIEEPMLVLDIPITIKLITREGMCIEMIIELVEEMMQPLPGQLELEAQIVQQAELVIR